MAVFLLINRRLVDDNLYSLRKGQAEISLNLSRLSDTMTEKDVRHLLPDVPLRCDPLGEQDHALGDRVCDSDIRSFNGIRALRLAFFFRDGALGQLKVDIPWWRHRDMGSQLLDQLGAPTAMQDKPVAGVRLVGWEFDRGNVFYNRDADLNPLWWNTVLWVSPSEARRMGGVFVKADRPAWREKRPIDLLMAILRIVFERKPSDGGAKANMPN